MPSLAPSGDAQATRKLEARLDVEVPAHGFFGIDALGDVDANESVHERRADARAAQRTPRMRKVRTRSGPAKIPEHDFAYADLVRPELGACHPERIADRGTGSLAAHGLHTAEEKLLLNWNPPT